MKSGWSIHSGTYFTFPEVNCEAADVLGPVDICLCYSICTSYSLEILLAYSQTAQIATFVWCRFWENKRVKLDYRPVHMNTLDDEVEVFPPKARVYWAIQTISVDTESTFRISMVGKNVIWCGWLLYLNILGLPLGFVHMADTCGSHVDFILTLLSTGMRYSEDHTINRGWNSSLANIWILRYCWLSRNFCSRK